MTSSPRVKPSRLLATGLTAGAGASPRVVGADGVWYELSDGRRVIDASNTAAPLGHGNPEIRDAVHAAAGAPALNEGLGWLDRELAADELLTTAFGGEDWVGAVRFFVSASEANDAALALCQALTGRAALATRERAYHGGAGLAREMTVQPHWHGGLSAPTRVRRPPALAQVVILGAPDGSRLESGDQPARTEPDGDDRERLAECAAVILDYSQGGVYHTAEYQDRIATLAREAGTYWVADETVTGFGRVGGWFQFQHSGTRPDIVTLGKSLSAGAAPAGAIVLSKEIVEVLSEGSWQSYSTFRGHPVAVAAIRAHLRIAERDRIVERARDLDGAMLRWLTDLAAAHPSVRRVDGRGLHWTVELHGPDWRQWHGGEREPLATRVAARALEAGALIATSGEQTSLFLAPPLTIARDELERAVAALDHGLELADRELSAPRARSR